MVGHLLDCWLLPARVSTIECLAWCSKFMVSIALLAVSSIYHQHPDCHQMRIHSVMQAFPCDFNMNIQHSVVKLDKGQGALHQCETDRSKLGLGCPHGNSRGVHNNNTRFLLENQTLDPTTSLRPPAGPPPPFCTLLLPAIGSATRCMHTIS